MEGVPGLLMLPGLVGVVGVLDGLVLGSRGSEEGGEVVEPPVLLRHIVVSRGTSSLNEANLRA